MKAVEPAKYKPPCREPDNHDQCDLEAQWKAAKSAQNAAFWTKWQTIFSAFGIIGLIVSLWQNTRALKSAKHADQHDLRAYVLVSDCKFIRFHTKGAMFALNITNYGKTPARHTRVVVTQYVAPWEPKREELREKQVLCTQGSRFVAAPTHTTPISFTIPVNVLKSVLTDKGKIADDRTIIMVGTISYIDIYDKAQRTSIRLRLAQNESMVYEFVPCREGNAAT